MVLSILLDQSKTLNTAQQGCMIAIFLGLNLSLNMMGKYVLGTFGFRFAIALTICHLVSNTTPHPYDELQVCLNCNKEILEECKI